MIDGAIPPDVRDRIVEAVGRHLHHLDLQGVIRPTLSAGHFGDVARALGAAGFDTAVNYMIDQNTLQRKEGSVRAG